MSNDFDLSTIGEIVETNSLDESNKFLKVGWVLFSTYIIDYGESGMKDEKTIYCIGWPKDKGEPVQPDLKSRY